MQVVFLTRKFPPSKGGMETFSFELTQHFGLKKKVIAVGQRQWHIIWAAPVLAVRAICTASRDTVLHWGDALLAPTAAIVQFLTRRPAVVTVHGLEITYTGFGGLVRWLVLWGLRHVRHVVAVSDNTAELLKNAGVSDYQISVIPHGVQPTDTPDRSASRAVVWSQYIAQYSNRDPKIEKHAAIDADSSFIVSVGRLVPRKGVAWFVEHVLTQLRDLPWIYLIASDGPERQRIVSVVQRLGLTDRVRLLGEVDEKMLTHLYSAADLFVMPNIVVPGDVEGFGFVAVEAASHGAVVISSNTQGIPSAIHNGHNGILLAVGDASAYVHAIRYWLTHSTERVECGIKARMYTLQHFRWDDVAQQYTTLFHELQQLQQHSAKKL